ncbi:hypothetical protein [Jeotgalibacillus sp. JSM ZJ347]|uniref:hypothetical protein n=1 Tax=Jeotgalibacillus sp. JSM ZJ347 TaxID=3342117 RepID=UPI0035A88D36
MKNVIEDIQNNYRSERLNVCFSIMDVELILLSYAEAGMIWCLSEMLDLTLMESLMIEHFTIKYRHQQLYDDLMCM